MLTAATGGHPSPPNPPIPRIPPGPPPSPPTWSPVVTRSSVTPPQPAVATHDRILQCLAAGESLAVILGRAGITDTDLTAVVRAHRLRITPDARLVPRDAAAATEWALVLGEHSASAHVRLAAGRTRTHLDALKRVLTADAEVRRGRAERALQLGAVRSWKALLRGMLADAEDELTRLRAPDAAMALSVGAEPAAAEVA